MAEGFYETIFRRSLRLYHLMNANRATGSTGSTSCHISSIYLQHPVGPRVLDGTSETTVLRKSASIL